VEVALVEPADGSVTAPLQAFECRWMGEVEEGACVALKGRQ
jgi:hypothetical protein